MKKPSLQDILQTHAQIAIDFMQAFEQLKAQLLSEDGHSEEDPTEGFEEEISLAPEKSGLIPEADMEEYSEGRDHPADQWVEYMAKYASGEAFELHEEAFPPSRVLIQDEIRPDEEELRYARGVPMGIPQMVWIHKPYAGTMIPDCDEV